MKALAFRALGKRAPQHDPRTLRLATYLPAALPPAPAFTNWTLPAVSPWSCYRNDEIGDCTIAAAAHHVHAWTASAGEQEQVLDEAAVLAAYSAIAGWDPARPETDGGAVELEVLKAWRSAGIGGHQIGAFAAVEPRNDALVRAAIHLFGGLYVGLALPLVAQDEAWAMIPNPRDPDTHPRSWGGHAVAILGYDAHGLTCITWGEVRRMGWAFFRAYCDEAWAILSRDFLRADGRSPGGFDVPALCRDLEAVSAPRRPRLAGALGASP